MSIKISQLANLTIAADTTSIPVIDYVANTLTTLQANVSTLRTYFVSNLTATLNSDVSALNASILAANVGMKGYVDAATSAENSAITTANTGMKGYVDSTVASNIATVNASIAAANIGMKGYVDAATSGENTAIATANVGMKGYVDQANTIQSNQITNLISNAATQSDLIIGINANVTAANVGMLGYVNSQSFYSNAKVAAYLPTYSGNIGNGSGPITIAGTTAIIYSNLQLGFTSPITFGNVILNAVNNANSYVQLNIQNINSFGNLVSADFIATAPDGTDTSKYIDMGINGNNFSSSAWTISGADDGYLYVNSGNLTLGTDTPNKTVSVHVGGTLAANIVSTFSSNGVTVAGNVTATNFVGSGAGLTNTGMVLLGTITPTANNSISLGSLTLTNYKALLIAFNNINSSNNNDACYISSNNQQSGGGFIGGGSASSGVFWLDLGTGALGGSLSDNTVAVHTTAFGGLTNVTTSTTIIYFRHQSTSTFVAQGSIVIYGVR